MKKNKQFTVGGCRYLRFYKSEILKGDHSSFRFYSSLKGLLSLVFILIIMVVNSPNWEIPAPLT